MNKIGDTHHTADVPVATNGAPGITVRLSWAARTDTGLKRAQNEDSLVAHPPIFSVADGMGGHAAGDIASAAVVSALGEISVAPVSPLEIQAELANATRAIFREAEKTGSSGGSTCVGAALTEQNGQPYWLFFNIGDSRAFINSEEGFHQVSVDHSLVQGMIDSGEISVAESLTHPKRNVITRAIGFEDSPLPDFWLIPVVAGESILCCSDGLTKELTNEEIEAHFSLGLEPDTLADQLMADALASGGSDNISIIVVRVDEVRFAEVNSDEVLSDEVLSDDASSGADNSHPPFVPRDLHEDWASTIPQ